MKQKYTVSWIDNTTVSQKIHEFITNPGDKKEESKKRQTLKRELHWEIVGNSSLKDAIHFPASKTYCVFVMEAGHYVEFNVTYLKAHVIQLLKPWERSFYLTSMEFQLIADDVLTRFTTRDSYRFVNDLTYTPFRNGNYHIYTKVFHEGFDLHVEVSYRLSFDYTEDENCPIFKSLLQFMSAGHQDRYNLLLCEAYTIIYSMTQYYNWMHLCGVSRGGKTQYTNTMIQLIGEEVWSESSVEQLSKNHFESQYLAGKKLITLSESSDYTKDVEAVKRYTGGDALIATHKHKDKREEFRAAGRILMVGNYDLRIRDAGNAIRNRHLFLKCENSYQNGKPLIVQDPTTGEWSGPMFSELGQIHAYLRSTPLELVDEMMQGIPASCPSQMEYFNEIMQDMTPVQSFVEHAIVKGDMCFLGFMPKAEKRSETEAASRRTIYPAYLSYCKRMGDTPYKVKTFSSHFVMACNDLKLSLIKKRQGDGVAFLGISLRKDFYDLNVQYGSESPGLEEIPQPPVVPSELLPKEFIPSGDAPLDNGEPFVPSSNVPEGDLELYSVWRPKRSPVLDPYMYEKYIGLFQKSPFKSNLQSAIQFFAGDDQIYKDATDKFMNLSKITSQVFKDRCLETASKDLKKITQMGFVCYAYKRMGTSPRIKPTASDGGPNQIKRTVRNEVLRRAGDYLHRNHGYTIIDYDLKACYTSVILGLFPQELLRVAAAMENGGIWKVIEDAFRKQGIHNSFHKDSVKVCVYSSFFDGKSNAMRTGITSKFCELAGVTPKEFKESTWSSEVDSFANVIVDFMQRNELLLEFVELSASLKDEWDGVTVAGPTGFEQIISKKNFRSSYANVLQSYEIALVAQSNLLLSEKHPDIHYLLHMHDGFTVAVPTEKVDQVTDDLNGILEELRLGLKLKNKVYMEVQAKCITVENRNWKPYENLSTSKKG